MSRFELAQLPAVPWRNGGGQTREIASGAFGPVVDGAADGWDWRLSVATIAADGAFSTFAGVDRVAVLLDGTVALDFGDTTLAWHAAGDAHAFAGEADCTARCASAPARFFNVMARRQGADAHVVVHRQSATLAASDATLCCLLVLAGRFQIVGPMGAQELLAEQGWLCSGPQAQTDVVMQSAAGCLVEVQLHRATAALEFGSV